MKIITVLVFLFTNLLIFSVSMNMDGDGVKAPRDWQPDSFSIEIMTHIVNNVQAPVLTQGVNSN